MKYLNKYIIITGVILIGLAVFFATRKQETAEIPIQQNTASDEKAETKKTTDSQLQPQDVFRTQQFSEVSPIFQFSASIPENWQANYVPSIQAIDLSDQIFIRFFEASDFLTLSTVRIISQQNDTINGHQAVRYEIEKKSGVANFADQPLWRSQRHQVTDIRLSRQNPTYFYVFAKNPELEDIVFEEFLQSIAFHNDQSSYVQPLPRARDRISKKPFGLYITPETSPIKPDRFTGFHTGTDYEIFANEQSQEIFVSAICGGELKQKTTAGGYGGLAVQECLLDSQTVTVVYGHLDMASIAGSVGQYLSPGEFVGFLGDDKTAETDGARKHLHLGIHKESSIDIRGYVQNENELSSWIDPETILQ